MHLRKDIDINKFLSCVIKCQEPVFYHTKSGDSLNLNSILSLLVFQTHLEESDNWKEGTIHCLEEEDYALLKDFLYDDITNE